MRKGDALSLPKGWEIKTIGEVCTLYQGIAINAKTNHALVEKSELPLLRIKDLKNNTQEQFIDPNNFPVNALVNESDIIYTRTGSLGLVFTGRKGVLHNNSFKVVPNNEVRKDYLIYWLSNPLFKDTILKLASRAAQPDITHKIFKLQEIFIPTLEEQKQIVTLLDEAFAAIDKAKANIEKNIENAKELFQSKLNDIFSQKGDGWEEKTLGEVCSVLNGYAFKSKDAVPESNTQLLRMGNLYKNILDLDRKPVFYPDSFSGNHKDYLLKEGDLIMSLTGTVDKTDYGYTVKVPKIDVDLLLNQRIMKIEVHDSNELNKDYLKNYLLSPDFLSRLYDTASGTRQANLSSRTILTLKINYPKQINKQLEVVKQFKQLRKNIFKLENEYLEKVKNLEELKKSILQKAFAGELTEKTVSI